MRRMLVGITVMLLILAGPLACRTSMLDNPKALPVVFAPDARILFQGDSITDGNRGRNADPNHILGHGYVFIIAARHGSAFPERRLTFINRGISGNTIAELSARWDQDALELKPDILSILVGVNDAARAVEERDDAMSVEHFERQYDALLDRTIRALPEVQLVLCEPFVLPVGRVKERWERWQSEINQRRAVVERLAAKYRATVVHFQKTFDDACRRAPAEYWIWDGVHPTYSGHQLMAEEWLRTVQQFVE